MLEPWVIINLYTCRSLWWGEAVSVNCGHQRAHCPPLTEEWYWYGKPKNSERTCPIATLIYVHTDNVLPLGRLVGRYQRFGESYRLHLQSSPKHVLVCTASQLRGTALSSSSAWHTFTHCILIHRNFRLPWLLTCVYHLWASRLCLIPNADSSLR
jgi:hypothetical protein